MEAGTPFFSEIGVTTMGKVILPDKQPGMLPRRISPLLIAAAVLGAAVLALGGFLLVRAMRGPQAPLPFGTSAQLPPLPDGPALPQAGQQQLPGGEALPKIDPQAPPAGQPLPSTAQQPPPAGPPLPNTAQQPQQAQQPLTAVNPPSPAAGPPLPAVDQQPPPPSQPLPAVSQPPPNATPPPRAPEYSGTITWRWAIYPVDPEVLGILLGDKVAGNQFVALGVDVWNQSNLTIEVKSGDFRLVVDGRSYRTDPWSTGSASIVEGLPVMSPEAVDLLPGGSLSGTTSYMIPARYQRLLPEWRVQVPAGVKVVRIDPQ